MRSEPRSGEARGSSLCAITRLSPSWGFAWPGWSPVCTSPGAGLCRGRRGEGMPNLLLAALLWGGLLLLMALLTTLWS